MPKLEIISKTYTKLFKDLKALLLEGQKTAVEAANKIKVQTFWRMGERITEDEIGINSISQLSLDLNVERTLLSRIVKFYQTWPKVCPAGHTGHTGHTLSWAHFKELLALEDKSERNFYLNKAIRESWSRDQLVQKIKDDYYSTRSEQKINKSTNHPRGKLERKPNKMYLYSAIVEKVVDGDTILLRVDLGFDVWVNQRIRLRGIDCPEISTPEGQKAKEFVEDKFKSCFIVVIQTFKKIDMYGRYVCDLFYMEDETEKEVIVEEGNFLNQELLDAKLAILM